MRDNENLYDKLREMIGRNPGSLTLMESTIDVDLQVEYFECSKKIGEELDGEWALDQAELLADEDYPIKMKKQLLARLASLKDVRAYRAIERYSRSPDDALQDWSILALQESRMHLESHLLDENQVFISTGLGGKGTKLRYFVVLIARNRKVLTEFQQDLVRKEFTYSLEKYGVEIEEFETFGYLASFMLLMPIEHNIKDAFNQGIRDINLYGDFLRENCIVTNVKKLSFSELEAFIEQRDS